MCVWVSMGECVYVSVRPWWGECVCVCVCVCMYVSNHCMVAWMTACGCGWPCGLRCTHSYSSTFMQML